MFDSIAGAKKAKIFSKWKFPAVQYLATALAALHTWTIVQQIKIIIIKKKVNNNISTIL